MTCRGVEGGPFHSSPEKRWLIRLTLTLDEAKLRTGPRVCPSPLSENQMRQDTPRPDSSPAVLWAGVSQHSVREEVAGEERRAGHPQTGRQASRQAVRPPRAPVPGDAGT